MSVREAFLETPWGPAPEDSSPAVEWLEGHGRSFGHFIGGAFVDGRSGEDFETFDPATGVTLARVAQAGAEDVDAAVAAARSALGPWTALGGHGRARCLYALARKIQKHARLLAVLETMDNGKPIRETRDLDIPLVARHFYHHAGWAQIVESQLPGTTAVGVAAQVIPWNFPLLMLAWKIAPALAAGNTVVLKPAEFTPLSALCFAELCRDAGLPAGVVNIVTGDGRTGQLLVGHGDVDKVAFTGSTEVGRAIRAATAGSGKKLSLELGGKSPFVVFDDADLDSAVEGVVDAIWFNQGQVCCAGSRLLLQEGIADRMHQKLKARMDKLRVGNPLDKAVDIGAIVAPVQLKRIEELVEQGKAEGAECWQPEGACPKDGLFYPPTLFTNVAPASTLAQVEIFGPVLVSMTFRTPEEAVELANDTRYGLAASVWSESVNLALDIAPKLAAGVVWVNCTNLFDAAAGFGGYRESGYGREGGREGLHEYRKPKVEKDGARLEAKDFSGNPAGGDGPVGATGGLPGIDRTPKLYIGGKQKRPDGERSRRIWAADGRLEGEVGEGNRKDIRDAVEAAVKARGWSTTTAHLRAQILFFVGENLALRSDELAARLRRLGVADPEREVEESIARCFHWAAWADKYDGAVHGTPFRNVTLAMPEALGVLGIVCSPHSPLLGFVSPVAAALAMGNRVVVLPSGPAPLPAMDLMQVFETSDVPAGAVNIVTGDPDALTKVLADHDAVDALWHFGSAEGGAEVERRSVGNLKQTWIAGGRRVDWFALEDGASPEFLRRATQIKNIWVPYGE